MPKEDTQFKPGQSGNPKGRPKGSKDRAKSRALRLLDELFADETNLAKLRKRLQDAFDDDPMGVLMKIVNPLSPHNIELSSPEDKALVRISLSERPAPKGDKGDSEDA